MFLRIEGFQVEIKEVNNTWKQVKIVKNFKIGENKSTAKFTFMIKLVSR